jgi:hypothetical protein
MTSENNSDRDNSDAVAPLAEVGDESLGTKKRSATDADLPSAAAEYRIAARREANRMHALKSRQRSKALLGELQSTVATLNQEKAELERQNAVLRAQVDVLTQQNRALMSAQQQPLFAGGLPAQPSPGMPPLGPMTMPQDMNTQSQLLLGSLPHVQQQQQFQPSAAEQPPAPPQQPQGQQQRDGPMATDLQAQMNHQQQLLAAYSGAALPNFSGFLQPSFMLDPNTLSIMQSIQQAQLQQQQNQQGFQQQLQQQVVQQQQQEQHQQRQMMSQGSLSQQPEPLSEVKEEVSYPSSERNQDNNNYTGEV